MRRNLTPKPQRPHIHETDTHIVLAGWVYSIAHERGAGSHLRPLSGRLCQVGAIRISEPDLQEARMQARRSRRPSSRPSRWSQPPGSRLVSERSSEASGCTSALPWLKAPKSSLPLDEEVFLAQLSLRAGLLHEAFQASL